MKPETKGKAAVVLIISFIAFGLGTGTSILMPSFKLGSTNYTPNISVPTDLPPVYNVKNSSPNIQNTTVQTPTTNTQETVYQEPAQQNPTNTPNQTNSNGT